MVLNNLKLKKTNKEYDSLDRQILVNPILIVAKKTTIFNLCSIKRLIVSIFFMVLIPSIYILILNPTLFTADTTLTETLGMILYIYTYGLVFPMLISAAAGPLISEEVKSGTMLTLLSKPISRPGIVIGKFIALLLYSIVINVISLIILIILGLSKSIFPDLPIFFFIHFIYGLVLTLFFGGLTLGISCVFRKPRNVLLIPLFLIIFSFLIGLIIKQILIAPSYFGAPTSTYEDFQLYHFDISYHMGNFYKYLVDLYLPGASTGWGPLLLMFGIKKIDPTPPCDIYGSCTTSINFTIDAYYYLPVVSCILLLLIGGLIMVGGIFFFKKRDISG